MCVCVLVYAFSDPVTCARERDVNMLVCVHDMYVCVHMHIRMYGMMCVDWAALPLAKQPWTLSCMRVCMYVCICIYIYIYIYMSYIYIHIHTFKNHYACMSLWQRITL